MTLTDKIDRAFRGAWDDLWDEVKADPMVIGYRETHVHVLLGHFLIDRLEQAGLRQRQDVRVFFDETKPLTVPGTLPWSLLMTRNRPDIVVQPRRIGDSDLGIIVEIKCLRTTQRTKEIADELEYVNRDLGAQLREVREDIVALGEYSQLGSGKAYNAYFCLLHLHEDAWGKLREVDVATPGYKWQLGTAVDRLLPRRALARVKPKYDHGSGHDLFGENPAEAAWL